MQWLFLFIAYRKSLIYNLSFMQNYDDAKWRDLWLLPKGIAVAIHPDLQSQGHCNPPSTYLSVLQIWDALHSGTQWQCWDWSWSRVLGPSTISAGCHHLRPWEMLHHTVLQSFQACQENCRHLPGQLPGIDANLKAQARTHVHTHTDTCSEKSQ